MSIRDDKEPQIVINRARPITDFAKDPQPEAKLDPVRTFSGTLYLRLPSEDQVLYPKVRAILNMFPGDSSAVLYFADTKQRRGTRCALDSRMLDELRNVLGEENIVLK